MATKQNGVVTAIGQVPTATKALPAIILDDQGFQLLHENQMPFIDPTKGDGWQRIVWNPPAGYHAGMRYGLKCALYLLRCAPRGRRDRADEVTFYGNSLRELQSQMTKGSKSDRSGAHWAAWKFWNVILDFTMQQPTAANVERYYNAKMIELLEEEAMVLRAQLADARKRRRPKARR